MSHQVSLTALQAMYAQQTQETFLTCLTINPPIGSTAFSTIRVVDNVQPIACADGIYQPLSFRVEFPPDTDDRVPQVQLVLDNVDRSIIEQIRTIQGVPQIAFRVVRASAPDTIEFGPCTFSLLDASYDVNTITGTLGLAEDFMNQQVPGDQYTPTNSPGLAA